MLKDPDVVTIASLYFLTACPMKPPARYSW